MGSLVIVVRLGEKRVPEGPFFPWKEAQGLWRRGCAAPGEHGSKTGTGEWGAQAFGPELAPTFCPGVCPLWGLHSSVPRFPRLALLGRWGDEVGRAAQDGRGKRSPCQVQLVAQDDKPGRTDFLQEVSLLQERASLWYQGTALKCRKQCAVFSCRPGGVWLLT